MFLTKEQALSLMQVQEDGSVHAQKDGGMVIIGADWGKDSVEDALDTAEIIEIGGKGCRAMGHAIVVIPKNAKYQSEIVFFEHNEDKLKAFELVN